MATLLIGDLHGCYQELRAVLQLANFDPTRDTLWLTGDLVARGPDSLAVMRYLYTLGKTVHLVLGNHDLHLLAIYAGMSRQKPKDHLQALLEAPDADCLIHWLRHQPILQVNEQHKLVLAHAGITPQWDLATAIECAQEIEHILRSDRYPQLLNAMYGDQPSRWMPTLTGMDRLRFSLNAFTRMRYCYPSGELDMYCKQAPNETPSPLLPWFSLPCQVTDAGYAIAFGHWASLQGQGTIPLALYPLDTGCCWGGALTLLRWEDQRYFIQPAL